MYPTLGFLSKKHWPASSWSLFESSKYPHFLSSHLMELPTNHPKVCEMPKNASTRIRISGIKVKVSTSNRCRGLLLFRFPPLLRQGTRNTLLSRRAFRSEYTCRPFPTESTKSTPPIGCSSDPTHKYHLSSKVVTFLSFQNGP